MQQDLDTLKSEALAKIQSCKSEDELRELEVLYLGKKGKLTAILRGLSDLPKEEKIEMGKSSNIVKKEVIAAIENQKGVIEENYFNQVAHKEHLDVTLPGTRKKEGKIHPISQFIQQVEDTFGKMGFHVTDGPEIETEHYNFNALNIPEDHPAREMQDTFWMDMEDKYVLRTQTSSMQIRYMQEHQPPIRIIAPGKTYRKDSDSTHSPMFHQFEGLMVDKNISIANLRGILLSVLKELLHPDIRLRLRTAYFPFVEPGFEVDVSCDFLGKGPGWLELAGCGMVHPKVLENGGIDPTKYTGFAFGFGIERLTMIKHEIDNIRLFYENDARFLKQF